MLRAPYERGIAPGLIVGTSVGAINGTFIALCPQTVETADELADIWRVPRGQVFPLRPLSGLLGFLGSRDHLVPESGLRHLLAEHTTYDRLEETPIRRRRRRAHRRGAAALTRSGARSGPGQRGHPRVSCPRLPGRVAR